MEAASDDAAITDLEDRLTYAEILIAMVRSGGRLPAGVAMARPSTIARRVERILSDTALPTKLGRASRALVAAVLVPVTAIAAGTIVQTTAADREPVDEVLAVWGGGNPIMLPSNALHLNLLEPLRARVQIQPVSGGTPAALPSKSISPVRVAPAATLSNVELLPSAPSDSSIAPGATTSLQAEEVKPADGVQPADMRGAWNIFGWGPPGREGTNGAGPPLRPASCIFKQSGNELTGSCKNLFLETPVTGTVNGRSVHWDWFYWLGFRRLLNPGYQLRKASFDGTLGADNILRGTYKTTFAYRSTLLQVFPGTFQAKKQPSDPS
jgi:hypothetical protein